MSYLRIGEVDIGSDFFNIEIEPRYCRLERLFLFTGSIELCLELSNLLFEVVYLGRA